MPSSPDAGARRRWQAHFDEAHSLLERGEPGPAAEQAREAIRIDPGSGHAHFLLGLALERQRSFAEALAALAQALELAGGEAGLSAQAHSERAHIFLEQGRPDLSLAEARAAAGLGAEPGPAALALAAAYRGAGRLDEALAELDRALELCGGDRRLSARIRGEKGHILFAQEEYEPAIAEFRAAAAAGERSGDADLLLGLACKHAGRRDEALAALAEALRSAAGDRKLGWRIRFESAHILLDQGRPGLAAEQAREAIRLDAGSGHAHFLLGLALERQRRYDEALAALAETLELSRDDQPLLARAHSERAHIFLELDRRDEALAELDSALRLSGGDRSLRGRVHGERAGIFFARGEYGAAIAEFREAAAAGERSANAAFLLGQACARAGRRDEALAALAEALELSAGDPPQQVRVHEARADILLAGGEVERSLSESAQAAGLTPDAGRAAFALGSAYQRAGRPGQALAELGRALTLCGGDRELLGQVHEARAHIFFEQGGYASCRDELQAAAGLGRESAATAFLLGLTCKHTGRTDEALAALERALQLAAGDRPLLGQIHNERARIHFEAERHELAREGFAEALRLGHETEEAHLLLARSLLKLGRTVQGERELHQAAGMGRSKQPLLELMQLYTRLKKADSCAAACARYLEIEEADDAAENRALAERIRALGAGRRPDRPLKVKIVRTPFFEAPLNGALNYSLLPPLGMASLTAYLRRNGIAVDQDDLCIRVNHRNVFGGGEPVPTDLFRDEARVLAYAGGAADPGIDAALDRVDEISPCAGYDAVLLSLTGEVYNCSETLFVLAYSRYVKERHGPVIAVGGKERGVESLLEHDTRHIDHIGMDRGEKLLFVLLTALRHGVGLAEIPDTPVRGSGKVLRTDRLRYRIDPDYSGLPMDLYGFRSPRRLDSPDEETGALLRGFAESGLRAAQHRLMEGCFFNCIFCGASRTREVVALPPAQAVAQLRRVREEHGIRCFFFLNRMINVSKRYANEFCDEILRTGLDILWTDCARADNFDRDTLLKMRRAGCVRLIYGLETASPRLLKLIDKRIHLGRLEDILRWTDEAGILNGLEIISGFPGETQEDLQATVDFLLRNAARLDQVYCTTLYLEKVSKLFAAPEKYGITNVAKADPRRDPSLGSMSDFKFDEIGGLPWKEKRRAADADFEYLMGRTKDVGFRLPSYEAEHLIFYLYSKFDDKRKIVSLLKRAAAVM